MLFTGKTIKRRTRQHLRMLDITTSQKVFENKKIPPLIGYKRIFLYLCSRNLKHNDMIDFLDFLAMEAIEDAHEEHEREERHEDGEYDDFDNEDDE